MNRPPLGPDTEPDILFYSRHCRHSNRILDFLVKSGITERLMCLCVDSRFQDPRTKYIYLPLENGQKYLLPPMIHSVPCLLLRTQKHRVLFGDEIPPHYDGDMRQRMALPVVPDEPLSYSFDGGSISEQFTSYDLTPQELSAQGEGGRRPLPRNFVSVNDQNLSTIPTPDETFKSNKMGPEIMSKRILENQEQLPKLNASFFDALGTMPMPEPIMTRAPMKYNPAI